MNKTTVLLLGAALAANASADVYDEVGDTGDLMPSAQIVPGGINVIDGELNPAGDVDLYGVRFNFTGTLQIDAVRDVGTPLDMNLHAFNSMGNPLGANDDGSDMGDTGLNSVLFIDITPGLYYFGVGENNLEATDGMGNRIQDNDTGILIPDGILGGWEGSGTSDSADTGGYTIVFSEFSVPAPGSLALLGLGGLAAARRRR